MLHDLEDRDAVFAQLHRTTDPLLGEHGVAEYGLVEIRIGTQRQAAGAALELRHFTATHAEFLGQLLERGAGALQARLQLILTRAEQGNRQLVAQRDGELGAHVLEAAAGCGADAIQPDDVVTELASSPVR